MIDGLRSRIHRVSHPDGPDYILPGPGALLGAKLGIPGVPALDIRQQCAAMLFGLQTVHGLIQTRAAKTILFIGAEAHAGFMPWRDWGALDPASGRFATPEDRERADRHRHLAVLFGDGAGALVIRATDRDAGLRAIKICSDGRFAELLYVPGGGFRKRPYWQADDFENDMHIPRMDGRELFKFAVSKLPKTARALCAEHGVALDQIDVFLAHQANQRINEHVRRDLKVPPRSSRTTSIDSANTSGATIPILSTRRCARACEAGPARDGPRPQRRPLGLRPLGSGLSAISAPLETRHERP